MSMKLKSEAFDSQGEIPKKYTADGDDVSPPLQWWDIPEKARTLALIMDDPDAPQGTFVHWVVYNIPLSDPGFGEAVQHRGDLTEGTLQGRNDFDRLGYGGPSPPPGPAHRYFFKLYAIDQRLDLKPGATKAELEKAMEGHILDETQLLGTYGRSA